MSQASDFGRKSLKPTLRLTFTEGPRTGSVVDLEAPSPGGPPATLGRNRENTVTIDSAHLSRRHAEIFADALGRLFIRDAGSINGTIVNGRPVTTTEAAALNPGDQVRVGDTVFTYNGVVMADTNPEQTALDTRLSPPLSNRLSGRTTPLEVQEESNPSSVEGAYVYLLLRNGQRYLFEGEEATIGRGQGNDIVIDSNSISRQHARLQRTPAGIFVTDLGSTNKTFVNGVRADGPVLLRHNDVIRFGDIEVDFRIEKERQTGMVNVSDQTMIEILTTDATQREFTSNSFDPEDVNPSNWTGPSLEQLETALDLDIRIVGRMQRRASDALPENPPTVLSGGPGTPTPVVNTPFSNQIEVARVEGVYYTEGQGRAAQLILQDIRLGLRQGELVAVVGPSGSGKSELVQIMAGLLPADRGRVLILGRDIPTYESAGRRLNLENDKDLVRWRARNIGYYSSGQQLDPRRAAYEQLMQPMEQAGIGRDGRERQERAFERLALVEISADTARLRPTELTRTERQLVMLARALANDPPLILCDEPLGNLTSKAANFVFTLLQRLVSSNKTVLMVTQDQLWARNSSRMIEILDGAIIGSLV